MLVPSSIPMGFVPSNPLQLPSRAFGATNMARCNPARPQHADIFRHNFRNGQTALVMCSMPGTRKSPLAPRQKVATEQPRVRGKRFSSFLQFVLMGPLWFFVWRLLKPQVASAATLSPLHLAAATTVGTGMLEPTDVATILQEAMQAFGMNPANPEWMKLASTYIVNIIPILPKLLFQLSICLIAFRISTVAGASLRSRHANDRNIDLTTVSFLVGLVRYSMLLVAALIVFRTLGVAPPQSVTALITSVSLAIGLAFQSVLGNVAAGLMLLVFRPYSVGDKVNIGNRVGFVYDISLLTTRLDTEDNTRIQVPNSEVFKGVVENYTLNPLRRVEVPVLIAHTGDVEHTRKVLEEVVSQFAYLSIAGSTQPPKKKKRKKEEEAPKARSLPHTVASGASTESRSYLDSLTLKRKEASSQSSSSSSPSASSSKDKKPSSSSSSSSSAHDSSAGRSQSKEESSTSASKAAESDKLKLAGTDTDDGAMDNDQERLMNGLGWIGGLTQKRVKPAIKTLATGYDQFMRVAEIQYQNADISVMTKVPRPEVVLKEITPLGQEWRARVWAPSRRYNRVRCIMTEEVAKGCLEEGIPIVGMGPISGRGSESTSVSSAYLAGTMLASKDADR